MNSSIKKNKKNILLLLYIFIILFIPSIQLSNRFPDLFIEDILLIFIYLYFILNKVFINKNSFIYLNKIIIFIFLLHIAVISMMISYIYFDTPFIINDLMIIPQIIKYAMIYYLFSNIKTSNSEAKNINYIILIFTASLAIISILQYYNLLNINKLLTPLYTSRGKFLKHLTSEEFKNVRRVVGTFGNPNKFGFIMVTLASFSISMSLFSGNKLFAILILLIVIIAIVFTMSRTSIISLICIFLVALSIKFYLYSFPKIIFLIFFIFIVYINIGIQNFNSDNDSVKSVLIKRSKNYERSLNARIRDFRKPFYKNSENIVYFIFGQGPSKAQLRTFSHNDFAWFFLRFGLIGLILYLRLIYLGLKYNFHNLKLNKKDSQTFYIASFLAILNLIIFSFSTNIFKEPKLMGLHIIFLSLITLQKNKNNTFTD